MIRFPAGSSRDEVAGLDECAGLPYAVHLGTSPVPFRKKTNCVRVVNAQTDQIVEGYRPENRRHERISSCRRLMGAIICA